MSHSMRPFMSTPSRALLLLLLLASCTSSSLQDTSQTTLQWDFESEAAAQAFQPTSGEWKVEQASPAAGQGRVLSQLAQNPKPAFNVSLIEGIARKDLDISVAFNAVAGEIDQGGGPIWRAADGQNYYIARYNPLEDNYRVYTVVNGVRTELASADIPNSPGWHTLRVTMTGNHIQCYYDGGLALDVKDDTFAQSGGLGLWTKADAQTQFDDVLIR